VTRPVAAPPSKRLVAALKKRSRDEAAGQRSLDFAGRRTAPVAEERIVRATVTPLRRQEPPAPVDARQRAGEAFELGEAIETSDRTAAETAYRRALALAPDFVEAYLNLGALLCETARCRDAVALYDRAIRRLPDEALLHYNRAIALEDAGRDRDALAAYDAALGLDRTLADAHYNAARLHERQGDARGAVRHLAAYRRLQNRG
jgi:tetratricopeptide (TPR) repeat protein